MTDNDFEPHSSPRYTVLLVDDSPANLNVFGDVLKPFYNVRVAVNGQQAMAVASQSPKPDIILLDILMPEMNGYSVLQHLREDPKCQDIPVIFITALNENDSEEFGLALGAADFITKPAHPALLLARVKTQLALRQAHLKLQQLSEYVQLEATRIQEALEQIQENQSMLQEGVQSLLQVVGPAAGKIPDTFFVELSARAEMH